MAKRELKVTVDTPGIQEALEAAYQRGREHERNEWNPMVGRVLQVTQAWAVCDDPLLRDAARTIHAAIGGEEG